jgi:hypothetical protein
LLIPPKAGNGYLILAHQYVAAYLNIANGANAGVLGTALADAAALLAYYSNSNPSFATYPPTIPKGADHLTSNDSSWAAELASLLDQFNSGYIPGICNGAIIINKTATGGDATFAYTTTGGDGFPGSFNITTSGGSGSQTYTNIIPATYSVAETPLPGWALTNSSCSTGSPSSFTVAPGATVICTFSNTKE